MAKNERTTISRKDIISSVAELNDLSKADAEAAVIGVFETIKGALEEGNNVAIFEFGTFTLKDVPARVGRNPSTGEKIDIAASCKVSFKPSSGMKSAIKAL